MPRKKVNQGDRIIMDSAVGIAGWLIAIETLIMLEKRGITRPKDSTRVIHGALAAIDILSDHTLPHPAFEAARAVLEGQADAWSRNTG